AALQIRKKVLGEEHADVATCYNNVGNVLQEQGKLDEAMEKYEAALQIFKKVDECANVAMCYNSMGNVLSTQGKLNEAMEMHEAALQIRKKVLGEEHADVARSYNNMGVVLEEQGQPDEAMEKFEAALLINRKVYGEEHVDVAMCYNNMGCVLKEQGKLDAAMEKYDAALQIKKKVLGEEHADVASCYNNMGNVLKAQSRHGEAMEKYEAALQIKKKVFGADSADYSIALLRAADSACATKSSLDDSHFFTELNRIVAVDAQLLDSVAPSELAFGLRSHVGLLRLAARFGQRASDTTALEQWRANVQRLIDNAHPVVRALGLQELANVRDDGRFARATACESECLLAALRASASPCALREAT
ncbi:MAG: tetratricopeptide repeat protein, partial [Myxococcales bacterium]|nr:tetratricopeptide repeat protein [Myxococcales bacterium]